MFINDRDFNATLLVLDCLRSEALIQNRWSLRRLFGIIRRRYSSIDPTIEIYYTGNQQVAESPCMDVAVILEIIIAIDTSSTNKADPPQTLSFFK